MVWFKRILLSLFALGLVGNAFYVLFAPHPDDFNVAFVAIAMANWALLLGMVYVVGLVIRWVLVDRHAHAADHAHLHEQMAALEGSQGDSERGA